MKKILTILALVAITTSSLFAVVASGKSAQVQLNTSIKETEVSYNLYYNNNVINDGATKQIEVAPLTEEGKTDFFTIKASSNKNSDLTINVSVTPETFKTTINGSTELDSNILPQVNTEASLTTLTAGLHKDLTVNTFNLSWSGDENLTAGDYTSDIKVEYSIQ